MDFSIRKFAKFLDLNYMYYYQIEKNKRKISGKLLEALASKGFNSNWILTGEGSMMEKVVESDRVRDDGAVYEAMKPEIRELVEILKALDEVKMKAVIKIVKGLVELFGEK